MIDRRPQESVRFEQNCPGKGSDDTSGVNGGHIQREEFVTEGRFPPMFCIVFPTPDKNPTHPRALL